MTVVLGHFPDYLEFAARIGGQVFSIAPDVYDRMSPAARWAANRRFIDEAIVAGSQFLLATPPSEIKPGSVFEQEIVYMMILGFSPVERDGHWEMVR